MAAIKLSYVESKAYTGFKKHVGRSATGKPKCFYLGPDRNRAEALALALTQKWRELVDQGVEVWSDDLVKSVTTDKRFDAIAQSAPRPGVKKLFTLMDEYTESLKVRVPHLISPAWCRALTERIESAKKFTINVTVGVYTDQHLRQFVEQVSAAKNERTENPLSADSILNIVSAMRAFLRWSEQRDALPGVRHWRDVVRVSRRTLSPKRRIETFSIVELQRMWNKANARGRCWLALMLNTGMTSVDVSSLKHDEIGWDANVITHDRLKTGVTGIWPMWDITREQIAAHKSNDPEYVFATSTGKRLVRYSTTSKTDAVGLYFKRLLKKLGIKKSAKHLRKTGATLVRRHGGGDVARVYLCHAPREIADKHYLPADYERLAMALAKVRNELTTVFGSFEGVRAA